MDKGLDGGDERAVSGKPDRLMGPETVVVEAGRFTEDVVAAAMSVAGKVVERLELAKDGKVSFRHQRVFALFLDDLRVEETLVGCRLPLASFHRFRFRARLGPPWPTEVSPLTDPTVQISRSGFLKQYSPFSKSA